MRNINEIIRTLEEIKERGAWGKGVKAYALELAEELKEEIENGYINPETITTRNELETNLLNGATDWYQFSWGGCSLIYDYDIALRLCNKSELIKTDYGNKYPNKKEHWLDVQARALKQASLKIQGLAF